MKILSIEPTPSPNAMKLNMDEHIPGGGMKTYTSKNVEHAPSYIQKLFKIEGVKSIFQTVDFISIDRFPKGDWKKILFSAREVFGEDISDLKFQEELQEGFGEVQVYVQSFRNIPMQIRVKTADQEFREALSERFVNAAMEAGLSSPNLLRERKLSDWGIRYGDLNEVAEQLIQEIEAAYDEARIDALLKKAEAVGEGEEVSWVREVISVEEAMYKMNDEDWKIRFAALEKLKPIFESLPVIEQALIDPNSSIRRQAVVYLGEIKDKRVLPLLFKALEDSSPSVRRTAGDTLSDLGDPSAIQPMIKALKDKNKIVRWRAARFLYELGDESAIEALKRARDDSEFEVSLQVNIALERIEGGEAAEGTIWQQMTRSRN